jgi:uncharacterized protein (TIGR02466 family)
MTEYDVFGNKVVVAHLNNEQKVSYFNQDFKNNLMLSVKMANIKRREQGSYVPHKVGHLESSTYVTAKNLLPLNQKGAEDLKQWIRQTLLDNSHHFVDFQPKDVLLDNSWTNVMYKGSSVKLHVHDAKNSCASILYMDCPSDGGQLGFVGEDIVDSQKLHLSDYADLQRFIFNNQNGDLIMYPSNLAHGVTTHMSNSPRICIVIDAKYV